MPNNKNWFKMKVQNSTSGKGGKEGVIDITSEIGGWGIGFSQFREALKAMGDVDHYVLNIHSPGGDVFAAIGMCNFLKSQGKPITARILGYCASAATFFTCIADTVEMPENAFFLIHKPWSYASGNADELRDMADTLDKIEGGIMSMYEGKSKKTAEEIEGWMRASEWWTAEEAKEYGFVDVVTGSLEMAASVGELSPLGKVPEAVEALAGKEPEKSWAQNILEKIGASLGGTVSAKERMEFEAAKQDVEKLRDSVKMEKEALDKEKIAVEALGKKLTDGLAEVEKRIAAGVADTVAEMGIPEGELPSAGASEPAMSREELLALVNNPATSHEDRWEAEKKLRSMKSDGRK